MPYTCISFQSFNMLDMNLFTVLNSNMCWFIGDPQPQNPGWNISFKQPLNICEVDKVSKVLNM